MGGLFSKPKVQKPDQAAIDAQRRAEEQTAADEARRKKQLASQKRAATYGGTKQLLYAGRDDASLGIDSGSGALGQSTV